MPDDDQKRRSSTARQVPRDTIDKVGARLTELAKRAPPMVKISRVVEAHRSTLLAMLDRGWTEESLVAELKADLPGLSIAALRFALHPSEPKKAARGRQKAAADAAPAPRPSAGSPAPAAARPRSPPRSSAAEAQRKPTDPMGGADVLAHIKSADVTKSAENRYSITWADQSAAAPAEIERRIALINANFSRFEPTLEARYAELTMRDMP